MAGSATLLAEYPVASREYPCANCRETIRQGETYECRRVWANRARTTVRTHILCPVQASWVVTGVPASAPAKASRADWWFVALCALAVLMIAVVAVATLAGSK